MSQTQDSTNQEPSSRLGVIGGLGVWVLIGFVYAWFTPWGRSFMQRWWWVIAAALFLIVAGLVVLGTWKRLPAAGQIAIVVFGILPVTLIMMAVGLQQRPEVVLRIVFLLGVCLLPATLNYLFSATRKGTLVHDFINNLERLGLLGEYGATAERQNRVYAYAEKFKALYGPVAPETMKDIPPYAASVSRALSPKGQDPTSRRLAQIFSPESAIPMVLATILVALGWFIALPPLRGPQTGPVPALTQLLGPSLAPEDNPVNFAFLGAYFFSIQMLFRRYVRMDLRGSAYVSVAIRIVIAVIGTWAAVAAFTNSTGRADRDDLLLLGFGIGIFPPIVWQVTSGWFKRKAGGAFPALRTQLPLHDLDGLTIWYQDRLVEEDIENVPNMATADIVELMLRTTLPPDRVVDWVDQAILYTHLGADPEGFAARKGLRAHGIRTASDLVHVLQRHPDLGTILDNEKKGPSRAAQSLADAVQTNPNLPMILTWRGLRDAAVLTNGVQPPAPSSALPLRSGGKRGITGVG